MWEQLGPVLAAITAVLAAFGVGIKLYRDARAARKELQTDRDESSPIHRLTPKEIAKFSRSPTDKELKDFLKTLSAVLFGIISARDKTRTDAQTNKRLELEAEPDFLSQNFLKSSNEDKFRAALIKLRADAVAHGLVAEFAKASCMTETQWMQFCLNPPLSKPATAKQILDLIQFQNGLAKIGGEPTDA